VVEEAEEEEAKKKRGPKGGIKHTPARDHARKSLPWKKKRIAERLKAKRKRREEEAQKEQREWEQLSEEARKLLQKPKVRPSSRGKK
jgi:hypothetical protein